MRIANTRICGASLELKTRPECRIFPIKIAIFNSCVISSSWDPRWSVPWAATYVADLIYAALAELQSCSQASSLRPDLAVNEMLVCDVCWQVVKERLLDLLNREEEEESHGEDVVKTTAC